MMNSQKMVLQMQAVNIHSPKVLRVLAKGEDMTTLDIKYLFSREVEIKQIANHSRLSVKNIREIKRLLEKQVKVKPKIGKPVFDLTMDKYFDYKKDRMTDQAIADLYEISITTLKIWSIKEGLTKPDMKGLTPEKYRKERIAGISDRELAIKYKVSNWVITGWANHHFTKKELKDMWRGRGV